MVKNHEIDFTSGPLLKKMILYALPIVGVNILQLLFNAADVAVLGIFTNDHAVAAVGSNAAIINLLIGFFVGLSIGSNVLVARCVGAKDEEKAKRLVGTSIFISILFGVILMIVGVILAEQILLWTNCDLAVLPYATKYLRIYFIGMPIIMLYNYCASILRAVGDTLRPFIYLLVGGIVNVLFNVFFVTVCKMDVDGVAIGTVVSQGISAACALVDMIRSDGYAKLGKKYFRIYKQELKELFQIGLPLGLSKCLFSFSNVVIQSNLNELGDLVMTANSIAHQYDLFIGEALHGITIASLAVISQNLGAKNMGRIKKTIFLTTLTILVVGVSMGAVLILIARPLCDIMTDNTLVIDYAVIRIVILSASFTLCGGINVVLEAIRGIGYSFLAMILSLVANFLLRIVYLQFVYPFLAIAGSVKYDLQLIYVVYPLSWLLTILVGIFVLIALFKKVKNKIKNEKENEGSQL